jgi:hypothetical protein
MEIHMWPSSNIFCRYRRVLTRLTAGAVGLSEPRTGLPTSGASGLHCRDLETKEPRDYPKLKSRSAADTALHRCVGFKLSRGCFRVFTQLTPSAVLFPCSILLIHRRVVSEFDPPQIIT